MQSSISFDQLNLTQAKIIPGELIFIPSLSQAQLLSFTENSHILKKMFFAPLLTVLCGSGSKLENNLGLSTDVIYQSMYLCCVI